MKKIKAIVLGVFTVIPALYVIFFISIFIKMFSNLFSDTGIDTSVNLFKIIFPLHISIMILEIVLLVIYIMDVFKNPAIDSDKRVLWTIVLFFGSMIAMIVYWIVIIWKPLTARNKTIQNPNEEKSI